MHDGISPLLTPKEVADLLKISLQTVYDNRKLLGGFCPAGIRVLRFRNEDIKRIMDGPKNQIVKAEIRDDRWAELRGRTLQRQRVRRVGPRQKRDRIKLIKELKAHNIFVDYDPITGSLRPVESPGQPKQKDGKKES